MLAVAITTRSSASQRDRATLCVSWNHINCCATVRKTSFEKACERQTTVKVDEGHYHFLLVCSLNSNVSILCHFEILPFLQCTQLPVTLRSSSVLIRQLKLQATYASQFAYKHTVYTHAIFPRDMGVRKVSKQTKQPSTSLEVTAIGAIQYDFLLIFPV